MPRIVFALALAGLSFGCAAASRPSPAGPFGPIAALEPALIPESMLAAEPAAQARTKRMRPDNYAALKGGPLYPSESDIDPGFFAGGVYGQYVSDFLSFEVESGYAQADPDVSGGDLFAIPMLLNARVTFPVWILDVYGGGGMGTTYYDFESNSLDVEGWLFTGDIFAGVEVLIRERMTAGLELKYHFTEEMERIDEHLDSLMVMATIGWRF